ncbi:MAG: sensor histidine kinase [Planctomycetes bacterium]|nr:sensor histidine kinase [Planctomycetota bacterium]
MRISSLTTRFVLTLLLSTAVPFLWFAFFTGDALRERQERFVDAILVTMAERAESRLVNLLEKVYGECSLFRSEAERALRREVSLSEFRDAVEFSPAFHEEYQLVVLADAEGNVLSTISSLAQDRLSAAAREALRAKSVRTQPWFRELIDPSGAALKGQIWLDRHLSPFLHRDVEKLSRDPADFSYGLAFPVAGDGVVSGVMLALKSWVRVQNEIDATAESLRARFGSATAWVSTGDGRVIAHSERERYGDSTELGAGLAVGDSNVGTFEHADEKWRAGIARITAVADPIAWRCGVAADEADLFADSRRFADSLLWITVVVSAILVVWGLVASRAILRPVHRLVTATERIAAGDFAHRVPERGRHELADLGRSFNEMAAEVAASRERLRDAERQAAWAEMARQVAHEIKNPLTPMRMSAQLLLRANRENDPRLPELVERLGRTVQEQTDALARIASDFRQFAGSPEREHERVPMRELFADVERDFAATIESGVHLTFDDRTGDAEVDVDRQEMRRVFLNIVQNALEAAGATGSVRVEASIEQDRAVVRVIDDGPGITDPEVRERLFEPYFTTRSAGTGLGLAICRRVVEAHDGIVELSDSTPGHTVFSVFLPLIGRVGRTATS